MASLYSCSALQFDKLEGGWECTRTESGAAACLADLADSARWLPATVPGTFAAVLRASGTWDGHSPLELDQDDIWYRVTFDGGAEETLRFEGLATIADVWLNGAHLFRSEHMFLP